MRLLEKGLTVCHNNQIKHGEITQSYIKIKRVNNESLLYAYRYAGNFPQYPENLTYVRLQLWQLVKIKR